MSLSTTVLLDVLLVGRRRERPRDPLRVHAAPPLPEVGAPHQAAAVQGLPVREPADLRHAELRRADQLPQIRAPGDRAGVGQEPGAPGAGEGALPGRPDPARGGGQLEVR